MKSVVLAFVFVVVLGHLALGQKPSPILAVTIDSSKFDDKKTGIKRYVNAFRQLESETYELGMGISRWKMRYFDLEKKIQSADSTTNCDEFKKWVKEAESLRQQIEEGPKKTQKIYMDRLEILVGPIYKEIEAALKDYIKVKGIALMFDVGRDEHSIIGEPEGAVDVTADFIEYFNNRYP